MPVESPKTADIQNACAPPAKFADTENFACFPLQSQKKRRLQRAKTQPPHIVIKLKIRFRSAPYLANSALINASMIGYVSFFG